MVVIIVLPAWHAHQIVRGGFKGKICLFTAVAWFVSGPTTNSRWVCMVGFLGPNLLEPHLGGCRGVQKQALGHSLHRAICSVWHGVTGSGPMVIYFQV